MNPNELFEQIKELIAQKDFKAAQNFLDKNKDQLGEYFDQAKALLDGAGGIDGVMNKVKGLFGNK
ncbi:hypothetical protein ACVRXS_05770 [Streptococcus orisratti]|uniref:hypothetical protein n=1 Tax=Streptococcus TaxID=1301 RepID=UPI00036BAE43|nr:hypothetical protein [Streptococcus orisratti]MCI7678172.1 hypothetical protein [Streptococcus orisratti]MDY5635787.1 hypothetical protein [Streptococcus orisratti]